MTSSRAETQRRRRREHDRARASVRRSGTCARARVTPDSVAASYERCRRRVECGREHDAEPACDAQRPSTRRRQRPASTTLRTRAASAARRKSAEVVHAEERRLALCRGRRPSNSFDDAEELQQRDGGRRTPHQAVECRRTAPARRSVAPQEQRTAGASSAYSSELRRGDEVRPGCVCGVECPAPRTRTRRSRP